MWHKNTHHPIDRKLASRRSVVQKAVFIPDPEKIQFPDSKATRDFRLMSTNRVYLTVITYLFLHFFIFIGCSEGQKREPESSPSQIVKEISERELTVMDVFDWTPEGALVTLEFILEGDSLLIYDAICSFCATTFRSRVTDLNGNKISLTCPSCSSVYSSPARRVKALLDQLQQRRFTRWLGDVNSQELAGSTSNIRLRAIAPVQTAVDPLEALRATLCSEVVDREPLSPIPSGTMLSPEPVSYFNEIAAPGKDIPFRHIWYRNGNRERIIELSASGSSWRTWSTKESLMPGVWMVTCETPEGDIFDLQFFQVEDIE